MDVVGAVRVVCGCGCAVGLRWFVGVVGTVRVGVAVRVG